MPIKLSKNMEENKATENTLKNDLESTRVLPQYMKELYLSKISSGKHSKYWVEKISQILSDLDKAISK